MLALLALLIVGFVVWKFSAPALGWASGFAGLLERPSRKTGLLPFIVGLETAAGDFAGRPVRLALHHKRGRHGIGYVIVAMRPRTALPPGRPELPLLPPIGGQSAFDDLTTRAGLIVSFDDGWLTARWQPVGFTMFPGRFDATKWRGVLEAMTAVATALEAQGPAANGA